MNDNYPLVINYPKHNSFEIHFNQHSGRIICREVNGFVTHTGIYIGYDTYSKEEIVIHHNVNFDSPRIVPLKEFTKGKAWYFQSPECINSPMEVISKGLDEVFNGSSYDAFVNNCQHLTNFACYNVRESHGVKKFMGFLTFCGACIGLYKIVTSQ